MTQPDKPDIRQVNQLLVPWDPTQYLKFAGHRLRPAVDLLAHVDIDAPAGVYDLGANAGGVSVGMRA